MFTAATVFVLPPGFTARGGCLDQLEEQLAQCPLKPVGPQELSSIGFVSPFGTTSEAMSHQVGDCILFSVGIEEKVLPNSAVLERLAEEVAKFEEDHGRRPGGKMRRELKANIITEMLAKAFKKKSRIDAYIDRKRELVIINTASRKKAEAVAAQIRLALGSFPALPQDASNTIVVLTHWVSGEQQLPHALVLGEECLLKNEGGGESARLSHHDLGADEVTHHLESGKQCQQLGVLFQDRLSAVINADLSLSKLKLLDAAIQQLENTETETVQQEIDARFALLTGELGPFIDLLRKHTGAVAKGGAQMELSITLQAA